MRELRQIGYLKFIRKTLSKLGDIFTILNMLKLMITAAKIDDERKSAFGTSPYLIVGEVSASVKPKGHGVRSKQRSELRTLAIDFDIYIAHLI